MDGVINVYKEKGFTSHDVVAKMRGILKQKKIGHTGTLDPDAVGVLPVCLGQATKLCDMLTDKDKTYEAVMLLGKVTDTQDISGKVLSEAVPSTDKEQIKTAIESFVGLYEQIPPMYSALKVNGKKLYELAREGKEVERKPRLVTIHQIQILKYENLECPDEGIRITMSVSCSKGTYIRTLCHDIGEKLGCGACMESLIRTKVSQFEIEEALPLAVIEQMAKDGTIASVVIPVEEMLNSYEKVFVKEEFTKLLHNGNPLKLSQLTEKKAFKDTEKVRVYDADQIFIGVYSYRKDQHLLKNEKMFFA